MPDGAIKVIVNQANDALGYIIPKPQYDAVEPFAYDEDGQYGEVNSMGYDAAPNVVDAVWEMYALEVD